MTRALTVTDQAGLPLAACLQGLAAGESCAGQVCGDPSCCTPFCSFRSETIPGVGFSRPVMRSYSVTRLLISYGRATGVSRFVFEGFAGARPGTPQPGTPSITVPHEPQFPPVKPGCELAGPLPFGDPAAPADPPYLNTVLNTSPASPSDIVAEIPFLPPLPPDFIPRPTGPEGLNQYLFTRDVFDRRRAVFNTLTGLLRIEHELRIGGDDTPSNQRATLRIEIAANLTTGELSGRASVGGYGVEIPSSELALDPLGTACNPIVVVGTPSIGGFPGSFNFAVPFLDGDAAVTISERYSIVRQVTSLGSEIVFIPSQPANPDAGNCPAECCPGVCGYVADQSSAATVTSGPVTIAGPNPATVGAMSITRPVGQNPPGCVRTFGGADWPGGPQGVFIPQSRIARRLEFTASREADPLFIRMNCRIDDATWRHFGFNVADGPYALQGVPGAAGLGLEFSVRRDSDGFESILLSDFEGVIRQHDRITDVTRPGASVTFSFDPCLNSVRVSGTLEDSPVTTSFSVQCDFADQAIPCAGATAPARCAGCPDDGGLVGVPA